MSNIIQKIRQQFFEKAQPLKPGLYNFQAGPENEFPYRLHLRIENDGEGILIINASTVLHLNRTAAEFAYHLVNETPRPDVIESIIKRYDIPVLDASNDFDSFVEKIETLIHTPDLDPISYLDFERQDPYSDIPVAPYRLDCALTYKLYIPDESSVAPVDRVKRELTEEEWKTILDKAWQAGIPHVVFTGGEPTLRPDLINLIKYAESLGQVTGVVTDGARLAEKDYLHEILYAGLDHLFITLDVENNQTWEALRDVLPEDIHVTVHITVTEENYDQMNDVLERLQHLEVNNLSFSTNEVEMKAKTQELAKLAGEMGLDLIWDVSVPYSNLNPVAFETQSDPRRSYGAGSAWLYVEPDGDVLPGQGINTVLGNFLEDDWDSIWQNSKDNLPKA
ncbi:MAG: hypothetical protein CL609_22485 [Anaerolineaceae bacterium]|nr:hypothetical protein [Anaerolineaceae bacterium]